MEGIKQEKQGFFPEWVYDPGYIPSMEDLKKLNRDRFWDDFIHHNPNGSEFQILTKEFLESFTDFLVTQISKIEGDTIDILEVGAGNGRLTHFLKEVLPKKITDKKLEFMATDNFSWDDNLVGNTVPFLIKKIYDVEKIPVLEAIKKNPDIVISSWMPGGEDWTKLFRETNSVKAFVLIGKEEHCGTASSWKEDQNFRKFDVPVEGSVSWDNKLSPDSGSKSKVVAFIRA